MAGSVCRTLDGGDGGGRDISDGDTKVNDDGGGGGTSTVLTTTSFDEVAYYLAHTVADRPDTHNALAGAGLDTGGGGGPSTVTATGFVEVAHLVGWYMSNPV